MDENPASGGLERGTEDLLTSLVDAAQHAFGDDLRSVLLFGSGAEGRLRKTSDLNLLVVLRHYEQPRVDGFREALRAAYMAVRASAMFLLESELPEAVEVFAVKFADIARRRRVLYGDDPLAGLTPSRESQKRLLRQLLMNLVLRLRERYAATSLREEQLAIVIAEAAGPLRTAAATLLALEGVAFASPKQALERVAATLEAPGWDAGALALMSQARQTRSLPAGAGGAVAFQLMALAQGMRERAERAG